MVCGTRGDTKHYDGYWHGWLDFPCKTACRFYHHIAYQWSSSVSLDFVYQLKSDDDDSFHFYEAIASIHLATEVVLFIVHTLLWLVWCNSNICSYNMCVLKAFSCVLKYVMA